MPDLLDGLRLPVASDDPFSQLHGFVEETLAGTGRAVWIEGGPGSGKTACWPRPWPRPGSAAGRWPAAAPLTGRAPGSG